MSTQSPTLSLRIDLTNGERLGPGKIALLNAIADTGSISAAAKKLGMSYPRAWKLVENMNASFETPLIEAFQGGASRGGASLTDTGLQVIELYTLILSKADKATKNQRAMFTSLQTHAPKNKPK